MPWLKVSDTAGMHPMVLAPLTDPVDDGLDPYDRANALYGMVSRCATMSAGYLTDYVVTDATVFQVAGPQWRARAEAAERAGYWKRLEDDRGWLIIDDPTNFLHIRLAAELEWERARKRDNSNPALTVPVRLRDGDGCRYCGVIVQWKARKGGRAGTYDHARAGEPALSPDDLRVACRSCNAARGDRPDADEFMPPTPPPVKPFYGQVTAAMLAEYGHHVPVSTPRPGTQPAPATTTRPRTQRATATNTARPGNRPGTAASQSATPPPAGHRDTSSSDPAAGGGTRSPRPGARPDHATSSTPTDRPERAPPPVAAAVEREHRKPADSADRRTTGSGFPGRDGIGSGSGKESDLGVAGAVRRGRRGRRRSRPGPGAQDHPGSTTTGQPPPRGS